MAKQDMNSSMTKGQLKRKARKEAIKKERRQERTVKIVTYSILAVLVVGILSSIGYSVYHNITKIKPSSDYSAYLTDEGLILGVAASDLLTLAEYKNISVPSSEVEYSDESVNTDIQGVLENNSTLDTETDALIADGDKVNIDYVGSVDGEEFDGGNTNEAGTDLEIGSGSYIDDFEEQLIGHGVGDNVTVEATFPSDYTNTDLAGKNAVFEVVINGIYVVPEFNDAFVQENLSEYASTADEYRQYLKDTNYDNKLTAWLENYLIENTTVSSYPDKYTNHLKSVKKYEDQNSYGYMNDLYTSMGYGGIGSFEQYVGMSESDYDDSLVTIAKDQAKKSMIYQAIYEKEGLTTSLDEYATYFKDSTSTDYESRIEEYGKGYVMQEIISKKVMEFLKENAIVE